MSDSKFKKEIVAGLALIVILTNPITLFAAKNNDYGFGPVSESQAYKTFSARPLSEHSKILYLIDRFEQAKIQIIYEGHYFQPVFSAKIARWFLERRYKDETTKKWIMQWCNTSIPSGELIWVKLENGKFKLSREILLEELKQLESEASQSFLDKKLEISKGASAPPPIPGEITSAPAITAIPLPTANASN